MENWTYEILDNLTGTILKTDSGFISESEAEIQANMEANADNIKNYHVRTFPTRN